MVETKDVKKRNGNGTPTKDLSRNRKTPQHG